MHRSYSVEELARCLDVHKNTVRHWQAKGLEPIDRGRPVLFQGASVRSFLAARNSSRKQPCTPGTLYCFRCCSPRAPALGMVDFVPMRPGSGNLRALCERCETIMHRRVREADIAAIMPGCTVQFAQGQPRLSGQTAPSLNCDFKRQGYGPEQHAKNEEENLVWWGKDGLATTPNFKRYRHKLKGGGGVVPGTWWDWEFASHTDAAKKELRSILSDILPQDATITPKPLTLIERVIQVATDQDALVLDSFAGSGTTAHAVLAANARDGGNRRFILVEGEDYADRLTAERVRRVINGYAFTGTSREELLREPITFSKLRNANTLLEKVQAIETLDGPKFDRIAKTVRDGALIVTGERDVAETTPGLGGAFTYCELGAAIEMDAILSGEGLPDVAAMAGLLWHTATATPFVEADMVPSPETGEGLATLGSFAGRTYWLIYKPDRDWLKSAEAALSLAKARAIAATAPGNHLVFAPAKFVSRELLGRERLDVDYAPLPFALYRLETA